MTIEVVQDPAFFKWAEAARRRGDEARRREDTGSFHMAPGELARLVVGSPGGQLIPVGKVTPIDLESFKVTISVGGSPVDLGDLTVPFNSDALGVAPSTVEERACGVLRMAKWSTLSSKERTKVWPQVVSQVKELGEGFPRPGHFAWRAYTFGCYGGADDGLWKFVPSRRRKRWADVYRVIREDMPQVSLAQAGHEVMREGDGVWQHIRTKTKRSWEGAVQALNRYRLGSTAKFAKEPVGQIARIGYHETFGSECSVWSSFSLKGRQGWTNAAAYILNGLEEGRV